MLTLCHLLCCTYRYRLLGRMADAFLYICSFFLCDGRMGCWALIRNKEPEAIPDDSKRSWRSMEGRQAGTREEKWVSQIEKEGNSCKRPSMQLLSWSTRLLYRRRRRPTTTLSTGPEFQPRAWQLQRQRMSLERKQSMSTKWWDCLGSLLQWDTRHRAGWRTAKGCRGQATPLKGRRPFCPDTMASWVWNALQDKEQSSNKSCKCNIFPTSITVLVFLKRSYIIPFSDLYFSTRILETQPHSINYPHNSIYLMIKWMNQ